MLIALFLLFLPALSHANITVSVQIDPALNRTNISCKGFNCNTISNEEIKTFGLEKELIKTAAEKCLNGLKPTNVYLKNPTDFGNLYTIYGLNEVHTKLKIDNRYISKIKNDSLTLTTYNFKNRLNATKKFNISVTVNVVFNVSTNWTKKGEVTPGENISYVVDFNNQSQIKFKAPWGINGLYRSAPVVLTRETGLNFAPGQEAKFYLNGSKVTTHIVLNYSACLSGDVACYCLNKNKGQKVWSCDINGVLSEGGLPWAITSVETLKIEYFGFLQLVAADKYTGTVLSVI